MFRKFIASLMTVAVLTGSVVVLSACNTMAGVGQDVENGGRDLKDKANEEKNK